MKYEYECPSDGEVTVIERSITDPEVIYYCQCGTQLARIYNPPAITFKGPGFYKNDK